VESFDGGVIGSVSLRSRVAVPESLPPSFDWMVAVHLALTPVRVARTIPASDAILIM
jgi:hypothetical protein